MKKLTFQLNIHVEIPADEVEMRNFSTGEIKKYSEIPESDLENFLVKSYSDIIKDGEVEYDFCSISDSES